MMHLNASLHAYRMSSADHRLEFHQQIQLLGRLFFPLVNQLNFAKNQPIQPIDGGHLAVAMFLRELGQSLHFVLGRVFSLAGRLGDRVTVGFLVYPHAQIVHTLAVHAVLAEERNGRTTDDGGASRSGTVQNGQRQHGRHGQIAELNGQCDPFVPTVIASVIGSCVTAIDLIQNKIKWHLLVSLSECLVRSGDGQSKGFAHVEHLQAYPQRGTCLRIDSGKAQQGIGQQLVVR